LEVVLRVRSLALVLVVIAVAGVRITSDGAQVRLPPLALLPERHGSYVCCDTGHRSGCGEAILRARETAPETEARTKRHRC